MEKAKGLKQILSLLLALSCIGSTPALAGKPPKLLLYLYVEGMQPEFVDSYLPTFSQEGIAKLLSKGTVYSNADFGHVVAAPASAIATLLSGSYPTSHGLGLGTDYTTLFDDKTQRGIYTPDCLSPAKLSYETVGDVLSTLSSGASGIYAVAADASSALAAAGRAGSAALWIDSRNGEWCSTSYYGRASTLLAELKKSGALKKGLELKKQIWQPLSRRKQVSLPYAPKEEKPFKYTFDAADGLAQYKQSALVNEIVGEMAASLIDVLQKEPSEMPRMLHVVLKGNPRSRKGPFSPYSSETIDAYLRADKAVTELLQKAEAAFGPEGFAVSFVTIPPADTRSDLDTRSNRSDERIFLSERARALINLYLSALHGKQSWVREIKGNYLYLDRALIERQGLSLPQVRGQVAAFMGDMADIRTAVPVDGTGSVPTESLARRVRRSIPSTSAADVFFVLSPYVRFLPTELREALPVVETLSPTACAVVWYVPTQEGRVVSRPVSIVSLAASYAYILRIRPPVAAVALPLGEITVPQRR